MKLKEYIVAAICLFAFAGNSIAQDGDTAQEVLQADDTVVVAPVEKVRLPFSEVPKDRVVGAVSTITNDQITTADLDVRNALVGRTAGLNMRKWNSRPGLDGTTMLVRGNHTLGNNAPMVVIDGIANRSLEMLNYYEIESVTVLKDVTAKALYGAAAANGVILVTTKRGKPGQKLQTFNAEYGVRRPTHVPEFLNSAQYAELYNESLTNNGLSPLYSPEQIEAYRNAGPNDTLPNVDYYGRYLKAFTTFKRFFGTYTNSTDKTRYYISAGYINENGLEAVGQETQYNRFNVRGNLDFAMNDFLSFKLDLASRIELTTSNRLTYTDWSGPGFFSTLSTHRPNEYPIYIGDGRLGWSPERSTNIEGELLRAGYVKDEYRISQIKTSSLMDFSAIGIKGLTWENAVGVDSYSILRYGKAEQYARFDSQGNQYGANNPTSNQNVNGNQLYRNYGFISTLNYDLSQGVNELNILANFNFQNREAGGLNQPSKNLNYGAKVNYSFDSKYVAEATLAYMGSNRLEKGNRFQLFPSAGIAWIASKEGFLESVDAIDFLKVKASYGQMGYDANIPFFGYRTAYNWAGSILFGPDQATNSEGAFDVSTYGNPNLGFEVVTELNVGVTTKLFDNLNVEFNYFNEYRSEIPMQVSAAYPDYLGIQNIPTLNFGEISNSGVEVDLTYLGTAGDVNYSVGGFYTYTKAVFEKTGDIVSEPHLNRDGQPVDRILGYVSEGFYNDAGEVNVISSLGGDVMAGDLKYKDVTGDGVINSDDRIVIGNSLPRHLFGLNFNVSYQGFNLFVLGQGAAGFNRLKNGLNSYTGKGDQKYAANALNRWTPENPNATHPRLTSATGSAHSYVGSTFWMTDAYYFTMRNIELSYSFPEAVRSRIGNAAGLQVFVRGTDLLSISDDPDFNADNPFAGLSQGFLMKTVSLGLTLSY